MSEATLSIDAARVELLLNELRLRGVKAIWPKIAAQSDKEGWPAARFLATLAEHKAAERTRRRIRHHPDCRSVSITACQTPRPPLPHSRNRKRQLPLQQQFAQSRKSRKGEDPKLDERLTLKPSSNPGHFSMKNLGQFSVKIDTKGIKF